MSNITILNLKISEDRIEFTCLNLSYLIHVTNTLTTFVYGKPEKVFVWRKLRFGYKIIGIK